MPCDWILKITFGLKPQPIIKTMKRQFILFALLICSISLAFSQEETSQKDTLRKDALNVYMEASSYLKERIPYINYVRDRKVADLTIISTSERNGSGGTENYMFLEGQGKYSGMIDTLKYSSSPDETYEQIRAKEVKTLKMGLMRYVQKTPLAKFMDIRFSEPISSEVTTDKWNNWVFRISLSGFASGQSANKFQDVFGSINAGKVTEDLKMDFNLNFSNGKDEYDIGDEIYRSKTTSRGGRALIVKSIDDHWSVGGRASVASSTYSNYDLSISTMPGIEYDIFPYSESTRRQFRLLYSAGYMYNNYTDTTIYNRTEEGLFLHALSASFEVIQKWGSIDLSAEWSNFLGDFSQNELAIDGSINWRVAKGLSINLGGSYSFIHNQINLVKGGASAEEILLRRKELETSYRYFIHFGFSYTFGSIYNNVVNPRFGSSSGNRIIIM